MKMSALIFSALLLLTACSESETEEKSDSNTTEPEAVDTTTTVPVDTVEVVKPTTPTLTNDMLFPFGKSITGSEQKSNEYGGGDCYGTVRQNFEEGFDISTDTMACSEYTLRHGYYLAVENNLQQVHIQTSSVLFESEKPGYALTEWVYDFTTNPTACFSRVDTLPQPDFSAMTAPLELVDLSDPHAVRDSLWLEYNALWVIEK
jgi:hypothetical protein